MTKKKTDIAKKTSKELEDPKEGKLLERHEAFIQEYLLHYNGTKAYLKFYPDANYDTARANASRLLAHANVKARVEELRSDLEKAAGISKLKVIKEFMSIGFSSFKHFQKDWMTKKEFEELSDQELACISEIRTETITVDEHVSKEVVKFKLHDKQRALENLSKLLGYNEQSESDAPTNIQINIVNPNK